jgi:hypothetical protein
MSLFVGTNHLQSISKNARIALAHEEVQRRHSYDCPIGQKIRNFARRGVCHFCLGWLRNGFETMISNVDEIENCKR